MTSLYRRLPLLLTLVVLTTSQRIVAEEAYDPANLPSPITKTRQWDPGSLDDLDEGPIKPQPYRWLVDDPVTPTSPSTVMPFGTEVDDLDRNFPLERPGIPEGWFTELELTAANPRISTRQQSGSLLSGTYPIPVAVPSVPLDWTVMPKFTIGYRRPEGLGDLSVSYRFLFSQGSGSIPQFSGGDNGNGSSRLQLHVVDLDYTLSDLFPTDLWLVPRQFNLTGGIRIAGVDDKTSASGGTIINQSASNTFVGAGPRIALESIYPSISNRCAFFTKFEGAGVIGSDGQSFSQTTGIASASATAKSSTIAVPIIGVRGGLNWFPDWGRGNVKMSAGYQWERWFNVGSSSDSFLELTIQGPFLRGEISF